MAPNSNPSRSLKEAAQTNPTLLGDPTSLKAEAKSSETPPTHPPPSSNAPAPTPTENDIENDSKTSSPPSSLPQSTRPVPDSSVSLDQGPKGSSTQRKSVKPDGARAGGDGKGSLKEAAMKNVTMLGDPTSLKAETSDHIPKPEENGAKGSGDHEGRLKSKI